MAMREATPEGPTLGERMIAGYEAQLAAVTREAGQLAGALGLRGQSLEAAIARNEISGSDKRTARLAELRAERGRLADAIAHARSCEPMPVSDRAVLRYVEHLLGVDVEAVRERIAAAADLRAMVQLLGQGEFPFEAEGRAMRAIVSGGCVVSVFPTQAAASTALAAPSVRSNSSDDDRATAPRQSGATQSTVEARAPRAVHETRARRPALLIARAERGAEQGGPRGERMGAKSEWLDDSVERASSANDLNAPADNAFDRSAPASWARALSA